MATTMKAAVLRALRTPLGIEDRPVPALANECFYR